MITIRKQDLICICGHKQSEHGSYGSCYKIKCIKTRKRNNQKDYVIFEEKYQCTCKEFKELE